MGMPGASANPSEDGGADLRFAHWSPGLSTCVPMVVTCAALG